MNPSSSKHFTLTWTLIACALRWGFGMFHAQPLMLGGDSESYVHVAEHILLTGNLWSDRPIVYPLFLALFYIWPGKHLWLILLAQSLVGALCIPLIQNLGHSLQQDKAGSYAVGWIAFDPFLIYFSGLFLSETLFITLMLAGLLCFVQFGAHPYRWRAFGAGVCFSLAALCRNILLPLVALLTLLAAIKALQKKGPIRRAALNFILTCAVCLGGWGTYVHHETGKFQMSVPQKGWSTYEGLNPDFNRPEAIQRWHQAMSQEAEAQGLNHDPALRDAYFWHKSKAWIQNHPCYFIRLMILKFFKFWRVIPYKDYYTPLQAWLSFLYFVPLLFLAILGSWFVVRKGFSCTSGMGFIIVFMMMYAFTNMITWTQIRYRIPLHPLLALLAGMGIEHLLDREKDRKGFLS